MRVLGAILGSLLLAVAAVVRPVVRVLRALLRIVVGVPLRLLGRLIAALAGSAWRAWQGAGPWRRWAAVVAGASIALSVSLWVAAVAFAAFSTEYGFHPATDAGTWRQLKPAYSDVARCVSCHEPEYKKLTSASHGAIGCESCHGPLAAHVADAPVAGEEGNAFKVTKPTDEVCTRCHVAAIGRPATFRQIVPAQHYLNVCLQCHDPHTGISRRPPVVGHTLQNLPTCITCHGPEGFKKRDLWHPVVTDEDKTCLLCHLPGRGPDG